MKPRVYAIAGLAAVGAWIWVEGVDGIRQRAANLAAGLGPRRDDETPLYYLRATAIQRLRLPEQQIEAMLGRVRAQNMSEEQIRALGDRLAEAARKLSDQPTPAEVRGALASVGLG